MNGKCGARDGGLDTFDATLEQKHAECFFKLRHPLADGRRDDVFPGCGAGKATFFQGSDEKTERNGVEITRKRRDRRNGFHCDGYSHAIHFMIKTFLHCGL
ncbi:hypothetical protein GCM10027565_08230 [Bordetella tumulicola]